MPDAGVQAVAVPRRTRSDQFTRGCQFFRRVRKCYRCKCYSYLKGKWINRCLDACKCEARDKIPAAVNAMRSRHGTCMRCDHYVWHPAFAEFMCFHVGRPEDGSGDPQFWPVNVMHAALDDESQ